MDLIDEGNRIGRLLEVLDEVLHLLLEFCAVSSGKAEGSLDAGNMLKPSLARGLQISGATTFSAASTVAILTGQEADGSHR
jgi:ATP-dependent Clp protease ATP-binding subunit ClpA